MVAGERCTTIFPQGFTALRLEALRQLRLATGRLAHVGPPRSCTGNAGHVLCRALRLAPACYREFSFTADALGGSRTVLRVSGDLFDEPGLHYHDSSDWNIVFNNAANLATAMGQFAAVEGLNVQLSPDASSVIVRRN